MMEWKWLKELGEFDLMKFVELEGRKETSEFDCKWIGTPSAGPALAPPEGRVVHWRYIQFSYLFIPAIPIVCCFLDSIAPLIIIGSITKCPIQPWRRLMIISLSYYWLVIPVLVKHAFYSVFPKMPSTRVSSLQSVSVALLPFFKYVTSINHVLRDRLQDKDDRVGW